MRTNVIIDDQLMKSAKMAIGMKTKKDTIEEGLRLILKVHHQKQIRKYRGKLKWTGDLNKMRTDR